MFALICCSLLVVFLGLFAAAAAGSDMDPYTHIGFYVLSYNKKVTFFYYFYVFASHFFASIKALFMSICAVFIHSLAFELYFVSTVRNRILYMKRFSLIKFPNFNSSKIYNKIKIFSKI